MDAKIDDLGERARRTCVLCALALVAAGCEAPREPARATPARSRAPVRAEEPCTAGEVRTLATLAQAPDVLGIAFGTSGLVVYPASPQTLTTIVTDTTGRGGAPRTIPLANAERLLVVAAVGADFVVVTEGPCAATGERCLTAARLDRTGAPSGDALTVAGHASISRIRRHASAAGLTLALSTPEGAPWVDTFALAATGLTHTRTPLGRIARNERLDDVLAVTADAARFAVLHRIGSPEDPDGALVLETKTSATVIEALEDAAAIERFAAIPAGYAIIASFEFDRPLALRVRPDGMLDGPPARLAPGDAVPAIFGPSDGARLADDGQRLDVVVERATGDVIGRVHMASRLRGGAASVARTRDGFLVPFVVRDASGAHLRVRPLTCSEPSPR